MINELKRFIHLNIFVFIQIVISNAMSIFHISNLKNYL